MSQQAKPRVRPVVLIILDGFGCREDAPDNAISRAHMTHWRDLLARYPHTEIDASEFHVGLPQGQMGNSEVGHLNMGAGRVVYQDFTRVDHAIETGEFDRNEALNAATRAAVENRSTLHLMGLLSPGGVHSHERQIAAMVDLAAKRFAEATAAAHVPPHGRPEAARAVAYAGGPAPRREGGGPRLAVHAFLDGRDTPPRSAAASLDYMSEVCRRASDAGTEARIVDIVGRYFAMDRDKRWDRVQRAYELVVDGQAPYTAADPKAALEAAYARGENDEFVQPTAILDAKGEPSRMQDGDVVVFMNFRADRARELTQALTDPKFAGFARRRVPKLAQYVCLASYGDEYAHLPVAFAPQSVHNGFGEYIAELGLAQLRIAETEKYAHVTYFFSGGVETPYPGEDRILIPSPRVPTYDQKPEMSAVEVTDRLVEAIRSGKYEAVICNYANPDMVGHTGNFEAAVRAMNTIDQCLGRVVEAARGVGGEIVITADHGNAEKMRDAGTGQAHTAHTLSLVPFVYIGRPAQMKQSGALKDVAPSLLAIMGLAQPGEMTGQSLVQILPSGRNSPA